VLEQQFAQLEERCLRAIVDNGIPPDRAELARSVDMRYRRQTHELIIPVLERRINAEAVHALVDRFERAYEDAYGKGAGFREAGIEITTFRVDAIGRTAKPRLGQHTTNGHRSRRHERLIYLPEYGQRVAVAVFQWLELKPRQTVDGPALVDHPETTVFIGPEQIASMDAYGNLVIQKRQT
jgi:N-methylhydantoinase A